MPSKKGSPKKELVKIDLENLCEEQWSCNILFMVEQDPTGNQFIIFLQQIPPKQIQDCRIKCLNKADILKEVKKMPSGSKGDKKAKGKDVELTDEQLVMKGMKENNIPSGPLARLIKKILFNIKVVDFNETEKLKNDFIQAQKKEQKKNQSKQKKKNKVDGEQEAAVVPEIVYPGRPQLCIIFTGFCEFDLPIQLLSIGIPVRALVKVFESKISAKQKSLKDGRASTDSQNLEKQTGAVALQSEKFSMPWLKFAPNFEMELLKSCNTELGSDTAIITFNLPREIRDPEVNVKDKKNIVFEQIVSFCSYVRELLEKYKFYTENQICANITEPNASCSDAELYKSLVNLIPSECALIPYVVHCMIEQVCSWENEETSFEHPNKDERSQILNCEPAIIMNNDEVMLKTFHLNIDRSYLSSAVSRVLSLMNLFDIESTYKGDEFQRYFFEFHLQRIYKCDENIPRGLLNIHFHWFILCKLKAYFFLDFKEVATFVIAQYNRDYSKGMLDRWISKMKALSLQGGQTDEDEVSNDEKSARESEEIQVDRKRSCNYKNVSDIKKERKKNLKKLETFLSCPEISCLLEEERTPKITDLVKNSQEFEYIENMTSDSLLQTLCNVQFTHSQVEKMYYPPTENHVLWFHNSKNDRIYLDNFKAHLTTKLGFRDFYSHVVCDEEDNISDDSELLEKTSCEETTQPQKVLYEQCYDLGKNKIEINQNHKKYVAEDGTSIAIDYTEWFRSSKSISLHINKEDTELIIHRDITSDVDNGIDELNEYNMSVLLKTPNNTLISVDASEVKVESEESDEPNEPTEFQYKFVVTLASGLKIELIEIVDENSGTKEQYIKQTYLSKGPSCSSILDEDYRCYTRFGVIKFYRSGNVDIIYHNNVVTSLQTVDVDREITANIKEVHGFDEKKVVPQENMRLNEAETNGGDDTESVNPIFNDLNITVTSWSGQNHNYNCGNYSRQPEKDMTLKTIFQSYRCLLLVRDDLKSIFTDSGELYTVFDESTKICTAGYEDETEEIQVDEEEEQDNDENSDYNRYESVSSLNDDDFYYYGYKDGPERKSEPLQDNSYASIKMSATIQHPNYAKVEYLPANIINLELPDDLTIQIENSGEFKVIVDKKTTVEFLKTSINFSSFIIKNSERINLTKIPLESDVSDAANLGRIYFLQTVDSFNNCLLVEKTGEYKYSKNTPKDLPGFEKLMKSSKQKEKDAEAYYENRVPLSKFERFFVVKKDFSGYEFLSKKDVELFEKEMANRSNAKILENPSSGRSGSIVTQRAMFKNTSESLLCPCDHDMPVPHDFMRLDLTEWTPTESQWLFVKNNKDHHFRRHTEISRYSTKRTVAVEVRSYDQITDSEHLEIVPEILKLLKLYENENNNIYDRYLNNSVVQLDMENRLLQTWELSLKLKQEFPFWNLIQTTCDVCPQTFGRLVNVTKMKPKNPFVSLNCNSCEKIDSKIDY